MEENRLTDFYLVLEKLKSGMLSVEEEQKLRNVIHRREDREREKRIAYELLGMLQRNIEYEWHSERGISTSQYGMENSGGLGETLYQARSKAGLTQTQLSELTGISQPLISRIERNFENPSLFTLKTLAEGLGMTLNVEFI